MNVVILGGISLLSVVGKVYGRVLIGLGIKQKI